MQRFYLMRMEALAGPNPNRLAKRDLPRLPHPPQFSPLILTIIPLILMILTVGQVPRQPRVPLILISHLAGWPVTLN